MLLVARFPIPGKIVFEQIFGDRIRLGSLCGPSNLISRCSRVRLAAMSLGVGMGCES